MSDSDDNHVPSAEFRASLEREIARAYRAEEQFGSPGAGRSRRIAVIVGLTVGAVVTLTIGLVLGASTSYASAEELGARQRQATASAIETTRRFAALELRVARTNYERVKSDFAKGVATAAALQGAEAELDSVRGSVSQIELNLRDARDTMPLPRPTFAILRGFSPRVTADDQNCGPVTAPVSAAETQAPASSAQESVPVVTLPAATARTTDTFRSISDVRGLPGGGILVDDPARRQVKAIDSTLGPGIAVIDSVPGVNSYGGTVRPLVGYLGDSTIFPSVRNSLMSMIDPRGAVARTLVMPTPGDAGFIRKGAADNTGRLVFAGEPVITRKAENGIPPLVADSTPLLRADFALRRTDTVAYVMRSLRRADVLQANGAHMSYWSADPLGTIDEWAVLTDGSIAMVRGHDYHIDWIRPDGSKSSTAKLPFDWRKLTDADKEKMLDSAQILREAAARNNTLVNGVDKVSPWPKPATGWTLPTAADSVGALFSRTNGGGLAMILPAPRGTLDQVFDYYPPMRSGSVLADLDNHLWILPTTSKQSKAGELVYDVVNTKGELFERVRVPLGRFIVGFWRGGVVYLAVGSLASGFTIERSKLPNGGRTQ